MLQKALITLGAVTVAGLAVLSVGRTLTKMHRSHLKFEFPLEELFV